MNLKLILTVILLLSIAGTVYYYGVSSHSLSVSTDTEQYSTTGPTPPSIPQTNIVNKNQLSQLTAVGGASNVLAVPEYVWRHGCGPTAVGMLFGYYDINKGTDFLVGDPTSQGSIDGSLASLEHYNDYSLPIDDPTTGILTDKSETGNAHIDNCIADYMGTSMSDLDLMYGWSYTTKLVDSIEDWSSKRNNPIQAQYYDGFSLSDIKHEIDNGRPFVVFMNAAGGQYADHFATCVGYDNDDIIIQTTWANPSTITTPLLPSNQQLGIAAIILTTDPITGAGVVTPSLGMFPIEMYILVIGQIIALILIQRFL
jgi:hypothetical protein